MTLFRRVLNPSKTPNFSLFWSVQFTDDSNGLPILQWVESHDHGPIVSLNFAIQLPLAVHTRHSSSLYAYPDIKSCGTWGIAFPLSVGSAFVVLQYICTPFSDEAWNVNACRIVLFDRNHAMVWNHRAKAMLIRLAILQELALNARRRP